MQTYLGSPTPTKTGGGIIMANVNTLTNAIISMDIQEFLEKLGLSKYEGIIADIELYQTYAGTDGFGADEKPHSEVRITITSEVEEVNA